MRQRPDREMLVLCGHTHGGGFHRPLPNLGVITGAAEYFQPTVQRVLDLGSGARLPAA
jgi:predicted MPP superfamily phosphohydrolase